MSKDWYAETCIPYGLHTYRRTFFMHRPIPKPCLSGYSLALPTPAKRFTETSGRTGAGLGDATHISSRSYRVAASIRPRVFLSKTMAPAIPCGRAGADWGWFFLRLNTLASQDARAGRARAGLRENRPNKKPLDQQLRDYPFIQLLVMSGMLALCITGATHSKAHAAQLVISATLFVLRRLYYQIDILHCDS